jgi:hypothetical protein
VGGIDPVASSDLATKNYVDSNTSLTAGDGIDITALVISADINTTNLQFTAGEINTIQDIDTTASPTFANVTITGATDPVFTVSPGGTSQGIVGGETTGGSLLSAAAADDFVINATRGDLIIGATNTFFDGNIIFTQPLSGNENARISSAGNWSIKTDQSQGDFTVAGDITIWHEDTNSTNPAFFVVGSTNGRGVNPELVIQSAETGAVGNDAPYHISRNARFQTSDDTYRRIGSTEGSVQLLFDASNNLSIRTDSSTGTGAITYTDTFTVTNGGDVGIDTTSPGSKLDIHVDTDNDGITINQTTASKQGWILFQDQGTNKWVFGKETNNNWFMYDSANSRDWLRVVSGEVQIQPVGGDILFGSGGTNKLELQGMRLRVENDAGDAFVVPHASNVYTAWNFNHPGTFNVGMRFDGDLLEWMDASAAASDPDSWSGQVYFTLDRTNRRIGVGPATAAARLHVNQNITTGAVPVLELDQDDIDVEFIEFDGTSASDGSRSLSSNTGTAAGKAGAIRVTINGTTRWIRFYDAHN